LTWSRFDDAAPKHPKAIAAGNEAWALWCGAVMYCNRYLTDGFVPWAALATECLPEPITPAKARKLAQRAVDAKIRQGGPGLFVVVEGGVMVHDFLEWNPRKADVESKRKADRDRKRRPPDSGSDSGGSPPGIPNGNPTGVATESAPPAGTRARVPARPAQPSPATTTEPEVVPVAERARKVLQNPYDATFKRPSTWPEVVRLSNAWSLGMPIRLSDNILRDTDLRAILEAIAAEEFTVDQLEKAGELAKGSEYFARQDKPGPASFTPAVIRRLLAPGPASAAGGDAAAGWFGLAEGGAS
jgi:hypothetical protein